MSKFSWRMLGLATIVAGGAFVAAISGASALTLPAASSPAISTAGQIDGVVQQAASKKKHQSRKTYTKSHRSQKSYKKRHGHQKSYRRFYGHHPYYRHRHYRSRRPGYDYYFGGWWYAEPWWQTTPPPLLPEANGSAHVNWCLNRYRSYNPATDMFLGFDGRYHRCRSPYRP